MIHERFAALSPAGSIDGQGRPGGSTWQSLARKSGSLETEFLNGEIVALGKSHGVPTPVNERLMRLASFLVKEQRTPGTLTDAEMELL